MRTCERLMPNTYSFESIEFKELMKGDRFRLFDDLKPVMDENGHTVWDAASDAYENYNGTWEVKLGFSGASTERKPI